MKKTEIILLLIFFAFLLLRNVDYSGGGALFALATLVLSLFYLFGSFKLFGFKNNEQKLVSTLAGISLASSIVTLPFTIILSNRASLTILPIINITFTVALLGIMLYRLIQKTAVEQFYKRILLRASIVLVATSFFAYRPIDFQVYRNIIIFLNTGSDNIINNMKIAEYFKASDKYLKSGDCDKAISNALLSIDHGFKWLGIDKNAITQKDTSQLFNIQGIFEKAYLAYDCKADKLYDIKDYNEALYYRFQGDSFLNINPNANSLWIHEERVDSYNQIGVCYDALSLNDSAVLFFAKAVKYHSDSIRKANSQLETSLMNLSRSLSKGHYWEQSSQIAKQYLAVLDKDLVTTDKRGGYADAYCQLAFNSIIQNKLMEAEEYLATTQGYIGTDTTSRYLLYKSILVDRLDQPAQTLHFANLAKDGYFKKGQLASIAACHFMLFKGWIGTPNYDSALTNIQKCLEIEKNNNGEQSISYLDYLKSEALYHYYIGNYEVSLKKLQEVKRGYESRYKSNSSKLPEVLSLMGLVKVKLGDFQEAKKLANEGLLLADSKLFFDNSANCNLLVDLANTFSATAQDFVADTLYRKAIRLNKEAGNLSSLTVARALNGLGNIALKKSRFQEADSLYSQCHDMYKSKISSQHPDFGIILMNMSELAFRKQRYPEALALIENSLENFTPFHKGNHPSIGDMYYLKASILTKQGGKDAAQELFERALGIYEANFQEAHVKIKNVRRELRR